MVLLKFNILMVQNLKVNYSLGKKKVEAFILQYMKGMMANGKIIANMVKELI